MRQCEILLHGSRVGLLTEDDHGEYEFTYDASYASDASNPPVSINLPLRTAPYRSPHLFPVFFNMLSEGNNRKVQSDLLHIDINDDFGIMLETATYETIGAITVNPLVK